MSNILRLFLIGFFSTVLFIAGCSGGSDSGVNKDPAPDLDGDGIADIVDPDIDGDGIPNQNDPDTPEGPNSNIACASDPEITWPGSEKTGEAASITWAFSPKGCSLADNQVGEVTASATAASGVTRSIAQTAPVGSGQLKARFDALPCGNESLGGKTEIAYVLNFKGKEYKNKKENHPVGDSCVSEPAQCPADATGDYPDCDCGRRKGYNPETNKCVEPNFKFNFGSDWAWIPYSVDAFGNVKVDVPEKPEVKPERNNKAFMYSTKGEGTLLRGWARPSYNGDFSGEHYLQIKLAGGSPCQNQMVTIYKNKELYTSDFGRPNQNKQTFENWEELRASEFGSCDLEQDWPCNGCTKGNFFLNLGAGEHTITKYSVEKATSPVTVLSTDVDNDGIPNGSDPDVDGDGIPNTSDKDIDGDGIENKNDPDIDGDGIKNGIDKDSDGDGTPDAEDETPGGPS